MKGIDVSAHNGAIDWKAVKNDGVAFAILRAGYGKLPKQKDIRFEENYENATKENIPLGAYWYSYATTIDEAKQEAETCISILKGKRLAFPIYFDLEEASALSTGKKNCSAMVRTFCNTLEAAGFWAGFYTSRSILSTHIEEDIKTRYALWVAEWGETLRYQGTVGIWQHSERGNVKGISGSVDLDRCYVNYPEKIRLSGRNGFSAPLPTPSPPQPPRSLSVTLTVDGASYRGTLTEI